MKTLLPFFLVSVILIPSFQPPRSPKPDYPPATRGFYCHGHPTADPDLSIRMSLLRECYTNPRGS